MITSVLVLIIAVLMAFKLFTLIEVTSEESSNIGDPSLIYEARRQPDDIVGAVILIVGTYLFYWFIVRVILWVIDGYKLSK